MSTVERTAEDPALGLAKVKNKTELKKWEVKNLEEDLRQKRHHLEASKLYVAVLKLYKQLSPADKKSIQKWIKSNSKTIDKYKEFRKLQKNTETAKMTNDLMQVELKYKASLLDLKEKNKKALNTSIRVKSYRPTEEVLKLYQQKNHTLPIFQGVKPPLGPAKLDKNGIAWMPGLGEQDPIPMDVVRRFENIIPGEEQENAQRDYETKIRNINNKTEDLLERLPRLDMDVGTLQSQIAEIDAAQQKIQPEITTLIEELADTTVTTALSILVEIKPERFQTSKSLLDALNIVLNHINTLGEAVPSPTQQLTNLLQAQIVDSKAVAEELDTTAKLLAKVDNALQNKDQPTITKPSNANKVYVTIVALILAAMVFKAWRNR